MTSKASSHSYGADGFMYDHIPPYHEPNQTNKKPFFYKMCNPTGNGVYFSKSSYFCDGDK